MAAIELLCHLIRINTSKFLKEEIFIIEAEIFSRLCEAIKEFFRKKYKDYFHLIKLTTEKEDAMLDNMFIRLVIEDILSTKEYSIQGIAYYTGMPEDVIQDVINGCNTNPSARLLRRSIDLHRLVRRELYQSIMKKIATDLLSVA